MTACDLHPEQERPCATCGVARVRAAMAAAPRPPAPQDPKPDNQARELAKARAKADREARR